MNESLCPKCGAYWECDCDVQPLFVVVEESGEISKETWDFLKKRAGMSGKRIITTTANFIPDSPVPPYQ